MKQLLPIIEARAAQERIAKEVAEEQQQYAQEQDEKRSQELRIKLENFLRERQRAQDAVNYMLDKEAADSDEDFNVFDQMAK